MSGRFWQMETAQQWGRTLTEFLAESAEDQSYMLAYTKTLGDMRAWEAQQAE